MSREERKIVEIELSESEAENLLNAALAIAESTLRYATEAETEEAKKNVTEQIAITVMLYDKIVSVFPIVAVKDSVKGFWERYEAEFREFIKKGTGYTMLKAKKDKLLKELKDVDDELKRLGS